MSLEYNKKNIPLAKSLRKHMTPWERKLWYEFLRSYPLRFQRQKAIGEYIVDFYCHRAKLVIELDGGGHYHLEQRIKDHIRTKELENMNLTVLRICNLDIHRNFSGVCEQIDLVVKQLLPQSASQTAILRMPQPLCPSGISPNRGVPLRGSRTGEVETPLPPSKREGDHEVVEGV